MGSLDGRIAFITGGARGQGRAHAIALAEAGADVVACDIADQIASVPYPMATAADLGETEALVRKLGRQCLAIKADVRDTAQMEDVVAQAIATFGPIDICVANAGVCGFAPFWEISDAMWDDMLATDLTGVFKTLRAVVPHMIERGYGRIVATSSMAGKMGNANLAHYVAAKWGVIGLVKTLALEVAPHGITVNALCPATVNTEMVHNNALYSLFAPNLTDPTIDEVRPAYERMNPMHVAWRETEDVSAALLYLVSDEARYVSGTAVEVSAGGSALMP